MKLKVKFTKKDKAEIMKAFREIDADDFWAHSGLTISEFTPELQRAIENDINETPEALEQVDEGGWKEFIENGLDMGLYEEFFSELVQ